MMPEEKEQLLALFDHERKWCQKTEAQDANKNAVHYNDPSATAWDVTGALCRLFGWRRACELFRQLDRHIHGKRVTPAWPARDAEMDSMAALQDFNDGAETTFDVVRGQLETMPVWAGNARRIEAASRDESASLMQT